MEIIQHYKNLYSLQDRILDLLVKYDFNLYLTGGTALNRFICAENSRFSDDLDFFTAESTLSARNEIIEFTQVLKENNAKIIVDSSDFKMIIFDENLKIDLVRDACGRVGRLSSENGFLLDNARNILSNKCYAAYSRDAIRDLFDIYIIVKNFNFDFEQIAKDLSGKCSNDIEEIVARIKSFSLEMLDEKDLKCKNKFILEDFKNNYHKIFKDFFSLTNIQNAQKILETKNFDELPAQPTNNAKATMIKKRHM